MLNDATPAFAETLRTAGLDLRDAAPGYNEEPRRLYHGKAGFVARPRTTEEVAKIVAHARDAQVGLIPYGGGTGLVGGQIASTGPTPLIVSLEKMTAIRAVYAQENTLVAEAGATLAEIHAAARTHDRLFPLSYASQDSARIGGALAVNSGGLNVLRYGTARELCLGVEAVLPNGDILKGLKRLRKDNTGYDLRHLLIGSEGTLGIITAAALGLYPAPARTATAFLTVENPAAALSLLTLARAITENLSAFELIPAQSFAFLSEAMPDLRLPFDTAPPWCVLIEIGTAATQDPTALLGQIFETAMDQGLSDDGQIAQSESQRDAFWKVRESIPEANRRIGAICSHDIALPLSELPAFFDKATAKMNAISACRINAFGHLGDGNLHFNIFPPKGETRDAHRTKAAEFTGTLHDLVMEMGGTFSAEHGVGRAKVGELEKRGDPAKLTAMRAIKSALDPLGIMNPGAVLSD